MLLGHKTTINRQTKSISAHQFVDAFLCVFQLLISELNKWKILNAVRGSTAILGWFIIALNPTNDRLSAKLQNTTKQAIGDALKKQALSSAA